MEQFFGGCTDDSNGRHWSSEVESCELWGCSKKLGWMSRHHCRSCGRLVCGDCSNQKRKLALFYRDTAQRTCDECDDILKHLKDQGSNQPGNNSTGDQLTFASGNRVVMLKMEGSGFGMAMTMLQESFNLANCVGSTDFIHRSPRSNTTHQARPFEDSKWEMNSDDPLAKTYPQPR